MYYCSCYNIETQDNSTNNNTNSPTIKGNNNTVSNNVNTGEANKKGNKILNWGLILALLTVFASGLLNEEIRVFLGLEDAPIEQKK